MTQTINPLFNSQHSIHSLDTSQINRQQPNKCTPLTNQQKATTHQQLKTALTTNKDQNQSDLTAAITAATTQTQQRIKATTNDTEKNRLNQRIEDLNNIKSFINTNPQRTFIGLIGWGKGCLRSSLAPGSNISAVDGFLYKDTNGELTYQRLNSCLEFFLAPDNHQKTKIISLKEGCSSTWDFGSNNNQNPCQNTSCCHVQHVSSQNSHLSQVQLNLFDSSNENSQLNTLKPHIIELLQFDHAYHELFKNLQADKEKYDGYVKELQTYYKELNKSQNPPPDKDWVKNTIQSLHALGCGLAHFLGKPSEEEDPTYNQRADISNAKSMIITKDNTPEKIVLYLNSLINTRNNIEENLKIKGDNAHLLNQIKAKIHELTKEKQSS
ncbi:MAG: hypothetical protein ACO3K7_02205 [Candidatus Marinamargulisbacteria bacterium]